jgi:hypothetical protein
MPNYRLGRLPHDPVAVAQAPAHRFGAVLPPPTLDRMGIDFTPGLFNNNDYPNCTAAGLANAARGVAALNGYDLVVDPDCPLAFYADCLGNPPNLIATDGAVILDVLAYQGAHGFNVGPQSLVGQCGTVALTRTDLALAMARLGPVYLGVTLLDRDMQVVGAEPWDVVAGRDDGAVVGGHCVIAWDYTGLGDAGTVRIGTWGAWQTATWQWLAARVDEAYALVWRQLARADGTFYAGLTADGLIAEL